MKTLFYFFCFLLPVMMHAQWEQTNGPVRASMIQGYGFKNDMVFAAITLANDFENAYGNVYRSHNHGDLWEEASSGLPLSASFFVTSFTTAGSYIFTGTNRGVWRSVDDGDHWIPVNNGLTTDTIITFMGAVGTRLFAFTTYSVYRSDDYGATWVLSFHDNYSGHVCSSFVRAGSALFFSDIFFGIYRSLDNGVSWEEVYDQGSVTTMITVGSRIYAGQSHLICSDDNGTHWTVINDTLPCWKMVVKGPSIFSGGWGYFYRSDDNGNSWIPITNGINVEYIITMGADNTSVYVGNYSANFRTDNDGILWKKKINGLPFDRVTVLATKWTSTYAGTNGGGIFQSTDLGTNWMQINNRLSCFDITSLAINGYEMYAGTKNGLFISNTGGEHWVPYNNGLTENNINMVLPVSGMLYACTEGGGVFISTDDGLNWYARNNGLANMNARCICMVGTAVYCGTNGGGVFRSSDQANTWMSVNTGLTSANITSIVFQGTRLFAGTDAGVFLSSDYGNSWQIANTGLQSTAINTFTQAGSLVFAGTGDGVYRFSDYGPTWINVSDGLPDTLVTSLAVSKTDLFAGIPGCGVWTRPLSDFSMLNVNPGSLTLAETANSQDTVSVMAIGDWTLQGALPGWLTVDKWSGTGNGILVFHTLQANPADQWRSAGYYVSAASGLSVAFTVLQKGKAAGLEDLHSGMVQIYPNPSTGLVHVESIFPMEDILVYYPDGTIIRQEQPGNSRYELDLSSISKGVHFIRIQCARKAFVKKIVLL